MKEIHWALVLFATVALTACANRQAEGPHIAQSAGWTWDIIASGSFDLAVASPTNRHGDLLTVYLEGDGFAYAHPSQPAMDPTPTNPVALRMALADPSSGPVAWIGRPCQYTMPEHGRSCRVGYWTTARYAPEIVDSIGHAIDTLKQQAQAHHVVLVGYSGGGALAVLLTERRSDVMALVTVAANLDLGYWTKRDGLTPLSGSFDPADMASSLGALPQVHFTGGQDKTVGTDVVRSFMARLPQGTPVRLVEVPDYTHTCCWVPDWPKLVREVER